MANISNGDIRTYINELVAMEFGSIDRKDNTKTKYRLTTARRCIKAREQTEKSSNKEETCDE